MRAEQIKPGMTYAIPANHVPGYGTESSYRARRRGVNATGTAKSVSQGVVAAPARVIAVGTFRWKPSGLCAREMVDDHYTTTVHVQIPSVEKTVADVRQHAHSGEKRIGLPDGLKIDSKKIVWVDEIFPASAIIMPWADFVKRHDEVLFVRHEAAAYYARLEVIQSEILALCEAHLSESKPTTVKKNADLRQSNGRWLRSPGIAQADVLVVVVETTYAIKDVPGVSELLTEALLIETKLECSR